MAMTREDMQRLASYGRNGDTMLAHINPQEAALLKSMGGAGTTNPKTGLPEFFGRNQIGGRPQVEMQPLPVLQQVFNPDSFNEIADKLNTITVPQQGSGLGVRSAYEKISPEFDQYANKTFGGMGTSTITGYTLPTTLTLQGKPLEARYDEKGNFKSVQLAGGDVLIPDPSRPNIASSPQFNKTGGIVDYGVFDLSKRDKGGLGGFVRELATELGPILQAVLAYYMPVISTSLAPSLAAAGITDAITQKAISNAIASTVVQVAQGKDIGDALQSSVITAATSTGSMDIAKQVNDVIGNQDVTNAILSAGQSAAQTALAGGSQSDIEQSVLGGVFGSTVASLTGNGILGSAAANAVTGGIAGAVETAAIGSAGAAGRTEATRIATERAKSAETKVSEIIGNELSKVGIAGALPVGETGAYARALENANQNLIRLVKEAANDVNYLQKLPELEDALTKSGTSISRVLGTGVSLGTYTPELNVNEEAELQNRLKDAKVAITFSPLTPTDVNAPPPVVNVDLTRTEDIDPRILDIVSPPLTGAGVANEPYSPTIVTPTFTPSTEPEVIPGTAPVVTPITTPFPDTTTSPGTSPTPGTEPIIDPSILPSTTPYTAPSTSPSTSTSTSTAPLSEPVISPSTTPRTATSAEPVISPPSVTSPFSPIVLPSDNVTSTTDTSATPSDTTSPADATETPLTDAGVANPESSDSSSPTSDTTLSPIDNELPPVEDITGTPTSTTPTVITTTKVTPETTTVLPDVLKTKFYAMPTSLTSLRGAGEIESPATGKKRKNVWNEESLRLKDALGL